VPYLDFAYPKVEFKPTELDIAEDSSVNMLILWEKQL